MECPFCHQAFDEIIGQTDERGNVIVTGCYACLNQLSLSTPETVSAA